MPNAYAVVVVERIDVPKENVDLWLDQDATDSRSRMISNTTCRGSAATTDSTSSMQVTFYAGHGFWATKGGNRLTVWEMPRPSKEVPAQ